MGRITSGVGLVSGINSRDIIDQLMALEARPKTRLQSRIDKVNEQRLAYTEITTRLTSLRVNATMLKKPSSFTDAAATSSNEDVLTATASRGAAVGSYQLRVARLVTTQQLIGRGFADFDTARVGAGTLTLELGGGEITASNNLNDLNGGRGVGRGQFRITDRSGASTVIDIADAVTLDDVVRRINNSIGVSVRAEIDGDRLVLNDLTGATVGNLVVQDIGAGTSASDLGIAGSVAAATLNGTTIQKLGDATALSLLNDGRGVRAATTGADFTLNFRDGSTASVTLGTARTVGDVLAAIRAAAPGKVFAGISGDGKRLELTDTTGGGGTFSVTAVGTSGAAVDLGLLGTASGTTLTGSQVLASLGTVMLSSLRGGAGLSTGTISIQSRAGTTTTIDLSGATSVADIIRTINNAAAGVRAAVNPSGNGLQIVDTTGGTGSLVISDQSGTTAAQLGIVGSFDTSTSVVRGANLQRAWVSETTLLADYNGGRGIPAGTFRITDANGLSRNITIDSGDVRLGDVINKINRAGLAVTARINDNGDGLLVESTGGATTTLKIEDTSGGTASALRIAGTAVAGVIDGSFERTVEVTATDTLATLQTKINDLNFGVSASILNDGSGVAPYRLSLTARNPGRDGRVVFDVGATTLDTRTLVEAQDAAVFVGGSESVQPLLVTAGSNSIQGVIRGVTINLTGASREPVTLNISRNVDNIVGEITRFVETFNELTVKIRELTRFDSATNTRGLLLGESSVQTVESQLYAAIQTVVPDNGSFRVLGDVGVRVVANGKLEFDESKFREAFARDPDAVTRLFTRPGAAIDDETPLDVLGNGLGIRTNTLGADLRITVKDGTEFDVDLSDARTIGDVIRAINLAGGAKLNASLNSLGTALVLTDNTTTGTASFNVAAVNGSLAAVDLGILGAGRNGRLEGRTIRTTRSASLGGVGAALESRISRLIDPVTGVLSRQNQQLDQRTTQFQSRITNLDKLLEAKRARLERQFSQLETVLASLQNQQSALGQIQTIQPLRSRNS
jgi:flagellar hook-associated protein 2